MQHTLSLTHANEPLSSGIQRNIGLEKKNDHQIVQHSQETMEEVMLHYIRVGKTLTLTITRMTYAVTTCFDYVCRWGEMGGG